MSLMSFFTDEEQISKKDDDHRSQSRMQTTPWSRAPAQSFRRRRIIYILCGILFIYLFIKNIPTDIGPHPRWADTRTYQGPRPGVGSPPSPGGSIHAASGQKPPRPATPVQSEQHYHDGPIKFYKLATSLHAVAKLGGQKDQNKNVLFAASSLKSVSELLPIACEMARWERNEVHLAIMGRDSLEIAEIQKVNGISAEDCSIYWHDARPDFSEWSTDFRMESSVAASLEHIQTFIHPQVVMIDNVKREDRFFVNAIREKSLELSKPLIELPSSAMENLMWITRLDSSSLAAWTKVYIDIIIQAPSGASGSIVRLLKSLEGADYFGVRCPHLTIELPATVDEPTARYLESFTWPPVDWAGAPHASQVTLRHRIQRKTTTPEEASARLVEAFWPKRSSDSHVLLLSAQVELSPLYFHYLFYSILEYRYSQLAKQSQKYQNMMGISLDLPQHHLDDKKSFVPPKNDDKAKASAFPATLAPFLWQSPNDNAALYFGDKWIEFHSFLSFRLTKPRASLDELVSKNHPAWVEYLFDFIRVRGYTLLYPGAFFNDFNLITTHNELYQKPEEYLQENKTPNNAEPDSAKVLEANASNARQQPRRDEKPLLQSTLIDVLPNKADLLEVDRMSLLSSSGIAQSFKENAEKAQLLSDRFKKTIGGCVDGLKAPSGAFRSAKDLFCGSDEPYDFQDATAATEAVTVIEQPQKAELTSIYDADKMSDNDAENARKESASHLDRQAGGSEGPVTISKQPEKEKLKTLKDVADTKLKDLSTSADKIGLGNADNVKPLLSDGKKDDDTSGPSIKKPTSAIEKSIPEPSVKSSVQTSTEPGKGDAGEAKSPGWRKA